LLDVTTAASAVNGEAIDNYDADGLSDYCSAAERAATDAACEVRRVADDEPFVRTSGDARLEADGASLGPSAQRRPTAGADFSGQPVHVCTDE